MGRLLLAGVLCLGAAALANGEALADDPADAVARAEALVNAEALTEARAILDAVLEADPGYAPAHREYARIHISEAHLYGEGHDPQGMTRAAQALGRAIELSPRFAEAHVLMGHVHALEGRNDAARVSLTLAGDIGGASPWLHLNWATLHTNEGDHEAALERCRRVDVAAVTTRILYATNSCVINALISLERLGEADAAYVEAVAGEPGHAWRRGNYAAFLLCRRDQPLEAAAYAREAIDLADSVWARATLSSALYAHWARQFRSGDADAEADAWQRAIVASTYEPVDATNFLCGGPATMDLLQALRDSGRGLAVSPMLAVLTAAEAADEGVPGMFALTVAATGSTESGSVYLNSEEDYRDQRNLTIRFSTAAAGAWRTLHREDPQALKGRHVTVIGYVYRKRIDFTAAGLPTGKFYYQTHLMVHEASQVMVGSPPAPPAPRMDRDRI
ncbi:MULTISPECIES: hypothetical protein [unclassified Luteimonas]